TGAVALQVVRPLTTFGESISFQRSRPLHNASGPMHQGAVSRHLAFPAFLRQSLLGPRSLPPVASTSPGSSTRLAATTNAGPFELDESRPALSLRRRAGL